MGRRAQIALPDHVFRVTARGKSYYYFQKHRGTPLAGKRFRIEGEPDTPEFWKNYHDISGIEPERDHPNSFNELVRQWHLSAKWQRLAPSTRVGWELHCKRILAAWGPLQVRGLTTAHCQQLYDSAAGHGQNNLLRCLSVMLAWSIPRGFRDDNPAQFVERHRDGEGYPPWSGEAIREARETLPDYLWWPIALALYTGQRQSDLLAMRWNAISDGRVRVRQGKTGKTLDIRLHRDLNAILDTIPRRATTILTNSRGRPWTVSGFRATWRAQQPEICRTNGYVFHGLRKSATTTLLEVGCTTAEVAAVTGQTLEMVAHYAKRVDQARLADQAIARWEISG